MTSSIQDIAPIYSSFGGDPLLGEIVELYVAEMPDRVAALERAFSLSDNEALRRSAHQMKGAAGSYGFDSLTEFAAKLEAAVRDGRPREQIQQALHELTERCRRIRGGTAER
jgi:HPt (histidine-containing phosphotransfer) domain-containing protein